jgi:hypothetical protein
VTRFQRIHAFAKMPVITGIWVSMKTTIELPEALFRRAKSMAAEERSDA